jgi:hypothetical protein
MFYQAEFNWFRVVSFGMAFLKGFHVYFYVCD